MTDKEISGFKVGDRADMEVDVSEEFVAEFTRFSGDNNPLHVDVEFARTTPFKRRVAHGMSYGALFSRLIGTELPGPGALWMSQDFRFKSPVFVGDTLNLSVEITALHPSTRTLTLECRAENQSGTVVTSGRAEVQVLETEVPPARSRRRERRIALVTGGTRGIGAAVARQLSAAGFDLAVTYHSAEAEAQSFAASLQSCLTIKSDAGDPDDARRLVAELARKLGTPDTLVLNASAPDLYGAPADGDFEPFGRHIDNQLRGPHGLVSACLDDMQRQGFGIIIGIGSTYATGAPPPGMAPYVVAKAALAAFLRCCAVEYGPQGIRANLVQAGMTETALLAAVPDRQRKVTAAQNPLRRLAQPEDVAAAVSYLASDEAAYVNGHTLTVSGGSFMP